MREERRRSARRAQTIAQSRQGWGQDTRRQSATMSETAEEQRRLIAAGRKSRRHGARERKQATEERAEQLRPPVSTAHSSTLLFPPFRFHRAPAHVPLPSTRKKRRELIFPNARRGNTQVRRVGGGPNRHCRKNRPRPRISPSRAALRIDDHRRVCLRTQVVVAVVIDDVRAGVTRF